MRLWSTWRRPLRDQAEGHSLCNLKANLAGRFKTSSALMPSRPKRYPHRLPEGYHPTWTSTTPELLFSSTTMRPRQLKLRTWVICNFHGKGSQNQSGMGIVDYNLNLQHRPPSLELQLWCSICPLTLTSPTFQKMFLKKSDQQRPDYTSIWGILQDKNSTHCWHMKATSQTQSMSVPGSSDVQLVKG